MAIKDLRVAYFYGKPGKADFTEKDLPANRIDLFKEVLKVRRGSMMSLNLLYLLIWIPAVTWSAINVMQLFVVDASEVDSLIFTYLLILFPLIAITGPFTAGISYVMRNWTRDEHSFIFSDFKLSMKENWKQALLMSTVSGAVPVVLYVCVCFYTGMAANSFLFYLPIAIVVLAALVWSLSTQIMPTMMVTYRLNFRALVKNCILISLATLPKAVGIKLITLILPNITVLCLLFVPEIMGVLSAVVLMAYAIFMLSFNKLVQGSFSNYVCEKYLNSKIEGAPTNIGLRKE